MTVRWAILGPGRIARTVAPEFALAGGAELVGVASRSRERADAFAGEFDLEHAFGSLEELAASTDVDAVYVATPHSEHAREAEVLAAGGKHLLIEKSIACSVPEVERIVAAAREHDLFCMEAMWTRFVPLVVELRRRINDGEIGDLRSVQGDLHAFRAFDPDDRLFNPALGGGALLDLGVYVVAFAHDFLGAPASVEARGHLLPNGVDGTAALLLGYNDGRSATLSCSFESYGPGRMALLGTDGWIDVLPRFHHPSAFVVHHPGLDDVRVELAPTGAGYTHEIEEATRCIEAGERESAVMPLSASLDIARVLADAREQVERA